jgi:hypothetical protein
MRRSFSGGIRCRNNHKLCLHRRRAASGIYFWHTVLLNDRNSEDWALRECHAERAAVFAVGGGVAKFQSSGAESVAAGHCRTLLPKDLSTQAAVLFCFAMGRPHAAILPGCQRFFFAANGKLVVRISAERACFRLKRSGRVCEHEKLLVKGI